MDFLDCLNRALFAGREVRRSVRYFFDNRLRGAQSGLGVIQRTLSGEGFIETGGRVFPCRAGGAMLFGHGEDSRYGYPQGAKQPYHLEFIAMAGHSVGPLFKAIRAHSGPVFAMNAGEEPARLFEELFRRARVRGFADVFHESAMVHELLTAMLRAAVRAPAMRDPVVHARELVRERFHRPVTVADIARSVGLAREHLTRAYRLHFGIPPGRELFHLRMDAAQQLLRGTPAPVEMIADRCGYPDADAFARAFKRHTGRSPREFRHCDRSASRRNR